MRMCTRSRLVALATLAVTIAATVPAAAAPDDREHCAASAEQGQQLKDEGKYRRAREQMLVCAREVCPSFIKSDCGKWLVEIDRDGPTIVLGARDARGDLVDVKVSMDGMPLQERLDGKPILTDSGEHTFRFESKDGAVKEERVLIRAAEKARPIIAMLGAASAPPGPTSPAQSTAPAADAGGTVKRGSIVPSLIAGGIGVVALGSWAFFGLTGMSDVDTLDGCRPRCAQEKVDSAETKLLIADISLGVGIVSLGVATALFLLRPTIDTKAQAHALRFDATPVAGGGGVAGVGGTF